MNANTDTGTDAKPEGLADEQQADLAALEAAAAGQQAGPVPVEQQAQAQAPSLAAVQMAGMAVGMLRPLICYAVPALRTAPAELWEPVPEGVAAVLEHYGASAEWMQSPWARLAISLAPLAAFAAMQAISQPEPAPSSKAVQIGTAQHVPEGQG